MSSNSYVPRETVRRHARIGTVALSVGILAGCGGLLEVELPGSITEETVYDPSQATVLVTSAAADIECAYSEFVATNAAGAEDVFIRVSGWWGGAHEYPVTVTGNNCNTADTGYGWYIPLHKGRFVAERAYEELSGWDVPNKDRLMAQAAIYSAVAYDVLGEHFCEVTADGGPLMNPDETLARAEDYLNKALAGIEAGGDFEIAGGVTPSAKQMAHLLRSRVRWARGGTHLAGAAEDAMQVQRGFMAYVTREASGPRQRMNKAFIGNNDNAYNTLIGPIDWWPALESSVIPFTGYRDLGVLPDGRAVSNEGFPVTTTGASGAVADPRVPVRDTNTTSNGQALWTQQKYQTRDADIPLANWQEAWLIRAEIEGGQTAIDLVNEIRAFHDLPLVTYLDAGDAEGIENLIIEERRRSLFLEGRFWSTKIQHQDKLWFPRGRGVNLSGHAYQGGVRMVIPENEFELNPGLQMSQRGSMCGDEAPVS